MRPQRRNRLILLLAVVTTLTLIVVDSRGGGGPLRQAASSIATPFQAAAKGVARPFQSIFSSIKDLATLRDRNRDLAQQNDKLRASLDQSDDVRRRLNSIMSMLDLAGKGGYRMVAAHVTAWPSGQDVAAAVSLDVGTADGVRPGMTVLTGRGLVGSTETVSAHSSSVRLITDPQAHVGVRVARTGRIGMTSGVASGADMSIQMLANGVLRTGEVLVTRGSLQGRPYVPGVPVGRVTAVTGVAGELPRGRVRPFADLGSLDIVAVVVSPPSADPRDALIPTPRPTPTVTVTVTAQPSAASASATASATKSTARGRQSQ